MKSELSLLYSEIGKSSIQVVGTPQFEFYFDEKHLMWSFSEIIIWHLAEKEREAIFHNEENRNEDLKKYIWDDFLRDNLAYFKRKK